MHKQIIENSEASEVKSSQMRLADAGTLYINIELLLKFRFALILTSVSGSGYVTREIIVHILIFPKFI